MHQAAKLDILMYSNIPITSFASVRYDRAGSTRRTCMFAPVVENSWICLAAPAALTSRVAKQSSQLPILIIGGGLGGLALASALKTHNIPYQVFERDISASVRAQGYRTRVQDTYLRQLLPNDLWAQFETCCGDVGNGFGSVNATTGEKAERSAQRPNAGNGPPAATPHAGSSWNADRRVLRELMMSRLVADGTVHFNKHFVRYEPCHDENGEDRVVAHFDDATHFKGRLLVGADGTRSAVRKQLLSDFPLLDTQGRSIFGKTSITDPTDVFWGAVLPQAGQGVCLIDAGPLLKMFCDTMHFSRRAESPLPLPSNYIYWVLVTRSDQKNMSDTDFLGMTPDRAAQFSRDIARHWDSRCREILSRQVVAETSTLAFATTYSDLKAWDAKSDTHVTLIGDAAHPITPVGSVGATAAFEDAWSFLNALLKCETDGETILAYEQEMRGTSCQYLKRSQGGAAHMFGMPPMEELKPWKLWNKQ